MIVFSEIGIGLSGVLVLVLLLVAVSLRIPR